MRLRVLFCALTAATASTGAHAEAPAQPGTQSVVVRLDDLNLASAAGGATALHRIRQAAMRACGGSTRDVVSLSFPASVAKCRADAVETAVTQAAIPTISRAFAEGRPAGMALARR